MAETKRLSGATPKFVASAGYQYFQIVRYLPSALRKSTSKPQPKPEKRKRFWQRGNNDQQSPTHETFHDWRAVTIMYFDDHVIGRPQFTPHMSATEMQATIDELTAQSYDHITTYEGTKKQVLIFSRPFAEVSSDLVDAYELDESVKRIATLGDFVTQADHEYVEIERLYPSEGGQWSQVGITYFDANNRGKCRKILSLAQDAMDYRISQIEDDGYQLTALIRQIDMGMYFREWLIFDRDFIGNPLNIAESVTPKSVERAIPETPFDLDPDYDYCRVQWIQERGELTIYLAYFDASAFQRTETKMNDREVDIKLRQAGWEWIEIPRPPIPLPVSEQFSYYQRSK